MTIYICPNMWYIISNNTFTIKIESMVKKGRFLIMEKINHNEYINTPYPIANTEGLYRVLVPTGGALKNGFESYFDYLTEKGQPIPEDLLNFLGNRYGKAKSNTGSAETQTYEYGYRIYRKPEGMDEKAFTKAVKSELSKPGDVIKAQAPSLYAVCEDIFDPTMGNFVSADENGFLLVSKIGSQLKNYKTVCGNVLINGRKYDESLAELGLSIDSMQVIDLSSTGIAYPADENGYYPVDMFYRKGSDPRVRGIHKNWISPTGEFVCQDATGEIKNITEESETINRYVPSNTLYTAPYVINIPNKAPVLLPTASQVLDRFPILADDALRRASDQDLATLDRKTEQLGYLFDTKQLTESQYRKGLTVINRMYDKVSECQNNMER